MEQLQLMIDTDRLDTSRPIDVVQICNTGLFALKPDCRQYGFALKDDGIEKFTAKVHIEVQHASELVISHIEKLGGVIRMGYFDMAALMAMKDTVKFFARGNPIPKRMIPPQDAIEYYTDPKTRGYLADPEAISHERLVWIHYLFFYFFQLMLNLVGYSELDRKQLELCEILIVSHEKKISFRICR